ncbi:hypothetical protein GCM10009839_41690 [Catenulispora yoronensis]|uniref:Uncharacterized protein n=1 Tax=Catenulispora yoronensis TaxID=450799 RepID=A0ABN2UG18_9ACTN
MSAQKTTPDAIFAATTEGSRTFAGTFVVEWIPSATAAELVVKVTAAGSLLDQKTFTPDNATQPMSGDNGTYSFSGTMISSFNAPPTSGTLLGQQLKFVSPGGGVSTFSGTIGLW